MCMCNVQQRDKKIENKMKMKDTISLEYFNSIGLRKEQESLLTD